MVAKSHGTPGSYCLKNSSAGVPFTWMEGNPAVVVLTITTTVENTAPSLPQAPVCSKKLGTRSTLILGEWKLNGNYYSILGLYWGYLGILEN